MRLPIRRRQPHNLPGQRHVAERDLGRTLDRFLRPEHHRAADLYFLGSEHRLRFRMIAELATEHREMVRSWTSLRGALQEGLARRYLLING